MIATPCNLDSISKKGHGALVKLLDLVRLVSATLHFQSLFLLNPPVGSYCQLDPSSIVSPNTF